jgi:hypothetical protein
MDKATLEKKLEDLKKPKEKLLKEFSESAKTTLPNEIGLKHPTQNVGVHIREDGALELFAGNSRIILDGETGAVVIIGNHLVTSTSDANINLTESNSFAINNTPLNSKWLTYKANLFSTSTLGPKSEIPDLSPVTFKQWLGGDAYFLTGTPYGDQHPIKFSEIFNSKPLFNVAVVPDFLSGIKDLLKEVTK